MDIVDVEDHAKLIKKEIHLCISTENVPDANITIAYYREEIAIKLLAQVSKMLEADIV